MSIRARVILLVNAVALTVGLVSGSLTWRSASESVHRSLLDDPVRKAATLIEEARLPLTPTMLTSLRTVMTGELVAASVQGHLLASTLTPATAIEFLNTRDTTAKPPATEITALANTRYRLAVADFANPQPGRLYLLVPEDAFTNARAAARTQVAHVVALAVLGATVVGALLAITITGPIRRLARRMDCLSTSNHPLLATPEPIGATAPGEVRSLACSFDRLLAALRNSQRMVERNARLAVAGKLAASAAHELRNPLSGIRMNAQVLAEELNRSGIKDESLDIILREAERMDVYLGELLAVRPPDTGAVPDTPLHRKPTNLLDIVYSVLRLLEPRSRRQGVTVRVEACESISPSIDQARIRQVVENLVGNALDAMPDGGELLARIESARDPRDTRPRARCEIRDSGPGPNLAADSDPFEAFVTSKPAGTGLGLHICRHIVAAHEGTIGLDRDDSWTVSWFEIPLYPTTRSP